MRSVAEPAVRRLPSTERRIIQRPAAMCEAVHTQQKSILQFVGRVERSATRHSFAGTTAGYAALTRPTNPQSVIARAAKQSSALVASPIQIASSPPAPRNDALPSARDVAVEVV